MSEYLAWFIELVKFTFCRIWTGIWGGKLWWVSVGQVGEAAEADPLKPKLQLYKECSFKFGRVSKHNNFFHFLTGQAFKNPLYKVAT